MFKKKEKDLETVKEEKKTKKDSSKKEEKVKKEKEHKPGLVERHKIKVAEREEMIRNYDLSTLTKPVNDVATSGPKKMKDFTPWPFWKNFLVGLSGILVVFLIWWLYSYIATNFTSSHTSYLSDPISVAKSLWAGITGKGLLWKHLGFSMQRILVGYLVACVTAIPAGFIMAWYKPFRAFLDPFIQFMRCIPPIAYVPIVVAAIGVFGDEAPKYFIIWMAVFLTMTVTIYQGVRNVDLTLVKAAYTFGARDRNLFTGVIIPSAFPFILTAMRLGIGAAMTTLIAAELTGVTWGLGSFVNSKGSSLEFADAIMGILVLGLFGIILDKILLLVEKRLTRWQ